MRMKINNKFALAQKLLALIISIFLIFSLSGCWDNKELDSVAIILGVGIDVIPSEEKLNYTFQLNKSFPSNGQSSSAGSSDKQFYNVETKSTGLIEAKQNIDLNLARHLFMEHNQLVLIGRDKAMKTVEDCLDAFMREGFLRIEVRVLVADNSAKEVMNAKFPQETVVAIAINKLIEGLSNTNKAYESKIYKFVSESNDVSKTTLTPIIGTKKSGDSEVLDVKGLAIFKKFVMVGELNVEYMKAYSWVMGYVKNTSYDLISDKLYANVNIPVVNYEIKTSYNEQNKPVVNLKYKIMANVGELITEEKMEAAELEKYIEAELSKQFSKQLYDCINFSKAINADIFGFGNTFHKNNLKEWKKIEGSWDEIYKDLEVNVEAEFRIFSDGKINDYINNEEETNA